MAEIVVVREPRLTLSLSARDVTLSRPGIDRLPCGLSSGSTRSQVDSVLYSSSEFKGGRSHRTSVTWRACGGRPSVQEQLRARALFERPRPRGGRRVARWTWQGTGQRPGQRPSTFELDRLLWPSSTLRRRDLSLANWNHGAIQETSTDSPHYGMGLRRLVMSAAAS